MARSAPYVFKTEYVETTFANVYAVDVSRVLTEASIHIGPPRETRVDASTYMVYELDAAGYPAIQKARGTVASLALDSEGYLSTPPLNVLLEAGHRYQVLFVIDQTRFEGSQATFILNPGFTPVAPVNISFGRALGGGHDTGHVFGVSSWNDTRLYGQRLRTGPPP